MVTIIISIPYGIEKLHECLQNHCVNDAKAKQDCFRFAPMTQEQNKTVSGLRQ